MFDTDILYNEEYSYIGLYDCFVVDSASALIVSSLGGVSPRLLEALASRAAINPTEIATLPLVPELTNRGRRISFSPGRRP